MNVWHKRFMYLQVLLLGFLLFINLYDNVISYVGLCVFVLLELGVLHNQNKENSDAVIYRKSCLFAFADLFSVFVFLFYFVAIFINISWRIEFESIIGSYKYLPVLFLYILIRKFYIIKNYSYEK
jgi:hypothetical protein